MASDKCDWQSWRLFAIFMGSFFVGGVIFIKFFHPPMIIETITEYFEFIYIGVDASEMINYDNDNNDNNDNNDIFMILNDIGINTIKLRLFDTALLNKTEKYGNISNVIKIGKRIYKNGMKFHLIIDYCDRYWKDTLNDEKTLRKEVYQYTYNLLKN